MKNIITRKSVVAIRHASYQDLGVLEPLLLKHGYDVSYLDAVTANFDLFDAVSPDLLVVLGGPYDVGDHRLTFMAGETEAVRKRALLDRATLGICLGAQILAAGLGARVAPLGGREIGWGPLTIERTVPDNPLTDLSEIDFLHWHGCGFDLPLGSKRLASTGKCQNQAFMKGRRILGLQFHVEVAPTHGIDTWIAEHPEELRSAGIDITSLDLGTKSAAAQDRRGISRFIGRWLAAI